MTHFLSHACRRLGRLAVPTLAVVLLLGVGGRGASAEEDRPDPPNLYAVEVSRDKPTALRFRGYVHIDNRVIRRFENLPPGGRKEYGVRVNIYQGEELVRITNLSGIDGDLDLTFGDERPDDDAPFLPSTQYCVGLVTFLGPGDNDNSLLSDESERLCATTLALLNPPRPDLAVAAIRGREDLEWANVRGNTPAYLVVLNNNGEGDADGNVVVDIATSGVVTLAEQLPVVRQGWEANGFTCVPTTPGGGANAGLRCSGGTLKEGQRINPAVMVRVTRPGYGAIHVQVGVASGPGDVDRQDNGFALLVRVY